MPPTDCFPPPRIDTAGLGAYVASVRWNADGTVVAFALGDGSVCLYDRRGSGSFESAATSGDQVLAIVATPSGDFRCSTDRGTVERVACADAPTVLARYDGHWIDQLAIAVDGRLAVAIGRNVDVLDHHGTRIVRRGPHRSSVSAAAFSPDGLQLAAAHYDGATIWGRDDCPAARQVLTFHGSHLDVCWSPDGGHLVTSTQEREVHVWQLSSGSDMRMSGYYAKPRSLSWSSDGDFLVTSGGDAAIAWSFRDGGPGGTAPRLLGPVSDSLVTAVACHPALPVLAAGYGDGTVCLCSLGTRAVESVVVEGDGSPVTCLSWSSDGESLAAGRRSGFVFVSRD